MKGRSQGCGISTTIRIGLPQDPSAVSRTKLLFVLTPWKLLVTEACPEGRGPVVPEFGIDKNTRLPVTGIPELSHSVTKVAKAARTS